MPALKKPRHELFVTLVASGKTPTEAYIAAGYKVKDTESARICAWKLQRIATIATRLEELKRTVMSAVDVQLQNAVNKAIPYLVREKTGRILSYEADYAAICELQQARATDPNNTDVPGNATGLLAVSRQVGGKTEYKLARFDAALMREKRELLKQIAIERDQWVERSRVDDRKLEDLSEEELRAKIAKMEAEEAEEARKAGTSIQ